jgi:cytochrome c oxidase subunit IV
MESKMIMIMMTTATGNKVTTFLIMQWRRIISS